ncbi:transcription antitermination factor NusB [Natronospora cellulosivora (SeqCode)]
MQRINRHQERIWALQILYSLDLTEKLEDDTYKEKIENIKIENQLEEKNYYFEKLISGVLENCSEYDMIINQTAIDWDINRMAYVDRNILRIALYEMNNDIPIAVVINEAVELAKEYADQKSAKFINGILAKIEI